MSEHSEALDRLFDGAMAIVDEVSDDEGTFSFEDFFYTLIQRRQKEYIEFLYLCRDYDRPFNNAHMQIGRRISQMLGPEYTNDSFDEYTVDIFHNQVPKYLYKRVK